MTQNNPKTGLTFSLIKISIPDTPKQVFLILAISSQEKIYLRTGSQFSQTKYHTIGSTYQYPTIKNSVKKNSLTSFNNVDEGPTMLTTSISINIRQRFNLRRSRVRLQTTSRKH